jgi:Leucine rich repeat
MLSSRATTIVTFINAITLSGLTLSYPSNATAEERAVWWLIDKDLGTSDLDERSLRQRYALTTLWFQTTEGFGNSEYDTIGFLDGPDWVGFGQQCVGSMTALAYLDLSGNALKGTIPTSLGSMTALAYLDLSGNTLKGTIPTSLGSLTDLTYLYLDCNALTGTVGVQHKSNIWPIGCWLCGSELSLLHQLLSDRSRRNTSTR